MRWPGGTSGRVADTTLDLAPVRITEGLGTPVQ